MDQWIARKFLILCCHKSLRWVFVKRKLSGYKMHNGYCRLILEMTLSMYDFFIALENSNLNLYFIIAII